jgi:hypothetical protein
VHIDVDRLALRAVVGPGVPACLRRNDARALPAALRKASTAIVATTNEVGP